MVTKPSHGSHCFCLYMRILCALLVLFALLMNLGVLVGVQEQLKSNHVDLKMMLSSLSNIPSTTSSSFSAAHLPEACRIKPRRQQQQPSPGATTTLPQTINQLVPIVHNLDGLPLQFLYNQLIDPPDPLQAVGFVPRNDSHGHRVLEKRYGVPIPDLPTNISLVCFPHGIFLDSTIAGPFPPNNNHVTGNGSTPVYHIEQNKMWFPKIKSIQKRLRKEPIPILHEYSGLGVQLSGWTTFSWSHFSMDTLLRLGLVYEALMNENDPLWGNAKIIVSKDPLGHNDARELSGMMAHLFDRLNLTHRLVFNNGWIVKVNWTHRFEFLAMPDYAPHTVCGNRNKIDGPIFPRHTLKPVQTALGLTQGGSTNTRSIVYAGRSKGNRAVDIPHQKRLLQAVQDLLMHELKQDDWNVVDWSFSGDPAETLAVFAKAAVVMGPHGGQLWNAALIPPGGLLMEFNTWDDIFHNQDCRTCGLSVANAAGLSYAIVDTPNFGYFRGRLLPNITQVVDFLRSFLTTGEL